MKQYVLDFGGFWFKIAGRGQPSANDTKQRRRGVNLISDHSGTTLLKPNVIDRLPSPTLTALSRYASALSCCPLCSSYSPCCSITLTWRNTYIVSNNNLYLIIKIVMTHNHCVSCRHLAHRVPVALRRVQRGRFAQHGPAIVDHPALRWSKGCEKNSVLFSDFGGYERCVLLCTCSVSWWSWCPLPRSPWPSCGRCRCTPPSSLYS